MKKLFILSLAILALGACASKKSSGVKLSEVTNVEGDKVRQEQFALSGIEMVEVLNPDGTGTVKRPYKWFAGTATADVKKYAIQYAKSNAALTISEVVTNIVEAQLEGGALANNSKVQEAIRNYWKQVTMSIQKGSEPFGDAIVQYNPATQMYEARVKVGMEGEKYQKMLNNAGKHKPADLQGEELQQFIETNQSIIEAAKGN